MNRTATAAVRRGCSMPWTIISCGGMRGLKTQAPEPGAQMETAPAVTLLSPAGKIPPPIENVSAAPTGAALHVYGCRFLGRMFPAGGSMTCAGGNGVFHLGFGGAGLIRFSQVASKPDFAAGAVFSGWFAGNVPRWPKGCCARICRGGGGRPRRGTSCTAGARRCCRGGSPVRIFAAPAAERFVVTVDADQVVAPEGHVAAFDEAGGASVR